MCWKNRNATTISRYCTLGASTGEQVRCWVGNNVVFHRMHIITYYDVYDFFSSHRIPRYSIESLLLLLYRYTEESVYIPSFGFNTRTTTTAVSTRTRAAGQPINRTKSFRRRRRRTLLLMYRAAESGGWAIVCSYREQKIIRFDGKNIWSAGENRRIRPHPHIHTLIIIYYINLSVTFFSFFFLLFSQVNKTSCACVYDCIR